MIYIMSMIYIIFRIFVFPSGGVGKPWAILRTLTISVVLTLAMDERTARAMLTQAENEAQARGLLELERPGWLWALIVLCEEDGSKARVDCRHVLPDDLTAFRDLAVDFTQVDPSAPGRFMVRALITTRIFSLAELVKLPKRRQGPSA